MAPRRGAEEDRPQVRLRQCLGLGRAYTPVRHTVQKQVMTPDESTFVHGFSEQFIDIPPVPHMVDFDNLVVFFYPINDPKPFCP
jgi:hypothetical protein